ncbi:MAG: TetR/AcrR family transcriptional regulator [Myxococcota bacterium]
MAAELSPSARQGQDRRDEILDVAVDIFGSSGFAGARVDDVARRVGIRRPSVLYHFADKQTLYAAALEAVVGEIASRIIATEHQGRPEYATGLRLEAIADVWVEFVLARPNAARMLLRELVDGSAGRDSKAVSSVRLMLESIQRALDERVAAESSASSATRKSLGAAEFSLILSSTSLVWVAGQTAVKGALGLDTLAPQAIARHRRTLHSMIRQLLVAAEETEAPPQAEMPVAR